MEDHLAWEGPRWLYAMLLCFSGLLLYVKAWLGSRVQTTEKVFTSSPPAFVEFQHKYLCVFMLFTLTEALQSVYGEALYESYGFGRREIAYLLVAFHGSSLLVGTFLGLAADSTGRKAACVVAGILQLAGCVGKSTSNFYILCGSNVCRGIAVSVFSSASEAWLTAEHERLGFKQEWLSRIFWVMAFGRGVAAVGTGAFANLVLDSFGLGVVVLTRVAAVMAVLCVFLVSNGWVENVAARRGQLGRSVGRAYKALGDQRLLLLGWTQVGLDLSLALFWFLWTPTLVADGRDIQTGIIYAYLMASLMLGSVMAALLLCGPLFVRPGSFLPWTFGIASLSLFVAAYDHQEVGVLVAAFCVFHMCVGLAWPSLAYLRSTYIRNDLRAGVMALFHVPVSIGVLFVLVKGGLMRELEISKIYYLCSFCLLSGAAASHALYKWRW